MNKKLPSILIGLIILTQSAPVYGESPTVEPNIYEKRDINIINDSRDNLTKREQLPEEQLNLSFELPEKLESNLLEEQLFQISMIETNTITSKADQLGLFSTDNANIIRSSDAEIQSQNDKNIMMVLIITVILVIAVMFIIVIPKLQPAPSRPKETQRISSN